MSLSLATYRARLLQVRDAILANDGGFIYYLNGAMADSPSDALVVTPLAILPLDIDSFTLHATLAELLIETTGNAATSGEPTWIRFADGDGVGILDLTAGPPGSGANVILTDEADPPTALIWTGGEITFSYLLVDP